MMMEWNGLLMNLLLLCHEQQTVATIYFRFDGYVHIVSLIVCQNLGLEANCHFTPVRVWVGAWVGA